MQHIFTIDGDPAEAWLTRKNGGYQLLCEMVHHDVALDLAADGRGALHIAGARMPVVIAAQGDTVWVHLDGAAHEIVFHDPVLYHAVDTGGSADDIVRAPMPGAVIVVHVEAGASVGAGQALMIIESMKLETVIKAPRDGVVEEVGFAAGQSFDRDAVLIKLAEED